MSELAEVSTSARAVAVDKTPKVAIVTVDQFSVFHFAVPCIVFDGRYHSGPLFELCLCAGEPGELQASVGISAHRTHGLEVLESADIIVVPFWRNPDETPPAALLNALVQAHKRGALLVGLCLGAYVLAYAGLLDGKKASTHWEFEQDFSQRFPAVLLDSNALYVEDEGVLTSAGTAAGLDCCLYVVRKLYGGEIANQVARRLVIPPHRGGDQSQFIERPVPSRTQDERINRLLDTLQHELAKDHSLDALAEKVRMSRRTFTRQFHKATGMSVGEWLTAQRLARSQHLLETTTLPIDSIALEVGFRNAVALRQQFKQRFAVTPSQWRQRFHQ